MTAADIPAPIMATTVPTKVEFLAVTSSMEAVAMRAILVATTSQDTALGTQGAVTPAADTQEAEAMAEDIRK